MKCVKGKYHAYSENVGFQGHDVNHSRSQCYAETKIKAAKTRRNMYHDLK